MNIMILVNSSLKSPYDELMNVQAETWDKKRVVGVESYFYLCDDYNKMHIPFREILKTVKGCDFIFRTNASSYVDKKRLLEYAYKLPQERFYAGKDGGGYASGCGFWLSKDLFPVLVDEITNKEHPYEDILIGQILAKHGIGVSKQFERCDYWDNYFETYHYRCKHPDDYKKTIEAMNKIHSLK
jgi:hypothetical protein